MPHGGGPEALTHQQRGAERPGLPSDTDSLRLARQLAEDRITAVALQIRDEVSKVQSRTDEDRHGPHDLRLAR